jgi:amidase
VFRRPGVEEVSELGKSLGLNLGPTEARIIQSRMLEQLANAEALDELRIPEQRLPLRYTDRDPGYRPAQDEDPLNVFIRKCRVKGAEHGPLEGKSIGLKDHISVAGVPMTFGCRLMEGYVPDFDATIVTRMLDAGGTIVGKMNMAGFSFGGAGIRGVSDYGRPLNPHDPAYVTGESSSGSAAAVAGNCVDIAFGGDQGGSIRIPASWCGVFGLKATYGLIPHTGVFGLEPTIDYVGPFTRTIEDMAVVLECVAGPDEYDARQCHVPRQLPKYAATYTHGIEGLRIGILLEAMKFDKNEPDVTEAVFAAIDVLKRAGAEVGDVSVPLHEKGLLAIYPLLTEGLKRIFDTNLGGSFTRTFYPTSLIETLGRFKHAHGHEFVLNIKLHMLMGAYLERYYQGRLYAKAQNIRPAFIRQYDQAFERVHFLAMPTVPFKPVAYREPKSFEEAIDLTLFGGESGIDLGALAFNTAPFNFTGHPAISIPCGKSNGLPIGLQLVAPFLRDDLLLRAAYVYERSAG